MKNTPNHSNADPSRMAAGSEKQFRQWLSSMPPNIGPNTPVTINCPVELFTTGWMDLASIARRMNWTLEETMYELLTHCSELYQEDGARFLHQLGADDGAPFAQRITSNCN